MLTVYGAVRSRTMRVLWLLEELGLDYEHIPAMPRAEDVTALNGTGKIPVMVVDGVAISDSVAIMTYLADREGRFTLPAGTVARAKQDAMTNYIVAEIDAALWLYAKHSFALPEAARVPEVKSTAREEFASHMAVLAQWKGDTPYLAGADPTIPDFLLSHCAGWGLGIKFPLPEGAFGDYLKAMRKRPAMARVMALSSAS